MRSEWILWSPTQLREAHFFPFEPKRGNCVISGKNYVIFTNLAIF